MGEDIDTRRMIIALIERHGGKFRGDFRPFLDMDIGKLATPKEVRHLQARAGEVLAIVRGCMIPTGCLSIFWHPRGGVCRWPQPTDAEVMRECEVAAEGGR